MALSRQRRSGRCGRRLEGRLLTDALQDGYRVVVGDIKGNIFVFATALPTLSKEEVDEIQLEREKLAQELMSQIN